MSTLISNLSLDSMKVRWQEPYVSEALNIALASRKKGIHFGWDLIPGGTLTVNAAIDSAQGGSLLVYRDTTNIYGITVWRDSSVNLDLTAFAGTLVYIGVTVSYVQGVATAGTITAYTEAEFLAGLGDVVVLGGVNVPGAGSIVQADIDTALADYAWRDANQSDSPVGSSNDVRVGWPEVGHEIVFSQTNDAGYSIVSSPVTGTALNAYRLYKDGATAGEIQLVLGDILKVRNTSRVHVEFWMETSSLTADSVGLQVAWLNASQAGIGSPDNVGLSSLVLDSTSYTKFTATLDPPATARYALCFLHGENIDNGSAYITLVRFRSEEHRANSLFGIEPFVKGYSLNLTHTIADLGGAFEGMLTKWTNLAADTLVSTLIGKAAATWLIGGSGAPVDIVNEGGKIKSASHEYDSTKTWTVQYLIPAGVQILDGSASAGIASPGTLNFAVVTIPTAGANNALLEIPQPPDGAVIRDIRIGIDDTADASLTLDVDLVRVEKFLGNASTLVGTTGLTRTGAANIRQVEWANVAYTPTYTPGSNTGIYALRIRNQGVSDHDIFWIEIEYEADTLEQIAGLS